MLKEYYYLLAWNFLGLNSARMPQLPSKITKYLAHWSFYKDPSIERPLHSTDLGFASKPIAVHMLQAVANALVSLKKSTATDPSNTSCTTLSPCPPTTSIEDENTVLNVFIQGICQPSSKSTQEHSAASKLNPEKECTSSSSHSLQAGNDIAGLQENEEASDHSLILPSLDDQIDAIISGSRRMDHLSVPSKQPTIYSVFNSGSEDSIFFDADDDCRYTADTGQGGDAGSTHTNASDNRKNNTLDTLSGQNFGKESMSSPKRPKKTIRLVSNPFNASLGLSALNTASTQLGSSRHISEQDFDSSSSESVPEDEYEVEAIIDHLRLFNGQLQYLVKWIGYDISESTWETTDHLGHCPQAIQEFLEKCKDEPLRVTRAEWKAVKDEKQNLRQAVLARRARKAGASKSDHSSPSEQEDNKWDEHQPKTTRYAKPAVMPKSLLHAHSQTSNSIEAILDWRELPANATPMPASRSRRKRIEYLARLRCQKTEWMSHSRLLPSQIARFKEINHDLPPFAISLVEYTKFRRQVDDFIPSVLRFRAQNPPKAIRTPPPSSCLDEEPKNEVALTIDPQEEFLAFDCTHLLIAMCRCDAQVPIDD